MRQEKTLKPVANFYVNELCKLTPMQGSEKAVCWGAQDFSEEAEGVFDKLAARFNTVEQCQQFQAAFEAARTFNQVAKDDPEKLVWAEVVEDVEEVAVDEIDTNKTADADGDE